MGIKGPAPLLLLFGIFASFHFWELHRQYSASMPYFTCVIMLICLCRGHLLACQAVGRRGGRHDGVHAAQQLHTHGLARHIVRQHGGVRRGRRLRARAQRHGLVPGPGGLVRPPVGAHGLRPLRRVLTRVRDRRLLRRGELHPRRRAARHAGRVHPGRHRREGLLRREPGGRVQRRHRRGGDGRPGELRHVRVRRVRRGRERGVPARAADAARREGVRNLRRRRTAAGGGGGVPERVRDVRDARVLLHGRARRARQLRADAVLEAVQGGVPRGVQLRVRRPHQHLHLRRRRAVPHHLLPGGLISSSMQPCFCSRVVSLCHLVFLGLT
jgi:hypothetical protein